MDTTALAKEDGATTSISTSRNQDNLVAGISETTLTTPKSPHGYQEPLIAEYVPQGSVRDFSLPIGPTAIGGETSELGPRPETEGHGPYNEDGFQKEPPQGLTHDPSLYSEGGSEGLYGSTESPATPAREGVHQGSTESERENEIRELSGTVFMEITAAVRDIDLDQASGSESLAITSDTATLRSHDPSSCDSEALRGPMTTCGGASQKHEQQPAIEGEEHGSLCESNARDVWILSDPGLADNGYQEPLIAGYVPQGSVGDFSLPIGSTAIGGEIDDLGPRPETEGHEPYNFMEITAAVRDIDLDQASGGESPAIISATLRSRDPSSCDMGSEALRGPTTTCGGASQKHEQQPAMEGEEHDPGLADNWDLRGSIEATTRTLAGHEGAGPLYSPRQARPDRALMTGMEDPQGPAFDPPHQQRASIVFRHQLEELMRQQTLLAGIGPKEGSILLREALGLGTETILPPPLDRLLRTKVQYYSWPTFLPLEVDDSLMPEDPPYTGPEAFVLASSIMHSNAERRSRYASS